MGLGASKSSLSEEVMAKVLKVFQKIDVDGSKSIDKAETLKFWKNNFAKLNTEALFSSVDADNNGLITQDEWIAFWEEVKNSGHTEEEISDELDNLMAGQTWVYFDNVKSEKELKASSPKSKKSNPGSRTNV
mmetsp:Transcript_66328/g.76964  ORF Transcript_66328/g.76964 Transcript_66328/m.76964 type:complete len:132 (-) Transcript_66328:119-514(-)|eukprot:CAMPEP_0176411014 /NCGR_PEP_ID=MMETSP0127-20121128/3373_1 /TAXON_ID=938130 /ORGANISM="Platyophrya macrostoma, Strain WH" /LENGTH=131 /DNA_ID=CAMNT_0017790567 /DNA_START=79 /DNA_END=474 /DNA_ORIENTATION=+